MVQTRLHKHSLSKKEQAVSGVASRVSVRDPIDEFQDVYGSRAASAAFRQQLGSDFSRSGQIQPAIQAKPSFRGLSQELAPIQAKLTVGPANDRYEQEADRVARQVVQRIHAPVSNSSTQGESVQRKEDEDELQRKPIAPIQRKYMSAGGKVSSDLESEINRARGGGQVLAPEMRLKMGEAMGADFSGVRVHTDGRADTLNCSVGARAFTTGQDLFFKKGEYNPGSRDGQELIAHELTHVVQQGNDLVQRNGDDKSETFKSRSAWAEEFEMKLGNYAMTDPRVRESVQELVTLALNKLRESEPDNKEKELIESRSREAEKIYSDSKDEQIGYTKRYKEMYRDTRGLRKARREMFKGKIGSGIAGDIKQERGLKHLIKAEYRDAGAIKEALESSEIRVLMTALFTGNRYLTQLATEKAAMEEDKKAIADMEQKVKTIVDMQKAVRQEERYKDKADYAKSVYDPATLQED